MVPQGVSPAISLLSHFLYPSYEALTATLGRFPGPADECEQPGLAQPGASACFLLFFLRPPSCSSTASLERSRNVVSRVPSSHQTHLHKKQLMAEKRIATLAQPPPLLT